MKKISVLICSLMLIFTVSTGCDDSGGGSSNNNNSGDENAAGADTTAPAKVEFKVSKTGAGAITLTWTEPSDADYASLKLSWEPGGASATTVNAGTTEYQITGLANNTRYNVTAKAVDAAGNESEAYSMYIPVPTTSRSVTAMISSAQELQKIADDLTGFYLLVADIDLSGVSWSPIGNSSTKFTGTFDGGSYTISNLKINNPSIDRQGLFGELGDDAVLQFIKLKDIDVTARDEVGGLVGFNRGNIKCCSVSGAVNGRNEVGAIVGEQYDGMIEKSYSTANVSGEDCVGGILGKNTSNSRIGKVLNSYSRGSVSGTGSGAVGGLVGINGMGSGLIKYCFSSGAVSGGGSNVKGFLPADTGSCTITNCFYNSTSAGKNDSFASDIDLKIQSNFTGWDFSGESTNGSDDIWSISSGVNNGYPYLTDLQP